MFPFRSISAARRYTLLLMTALLAGTASLGLAHESKAGDIVVDHPYALPTPAGAPSGALYFRALKNAGKQPDRLTGAQTPVAEAVEIHHVQLEGDVMRMREVDAIELPAGAELKLRHGGEWHLMLVGLKAPLKVGDRIPVVLHFEKAGDVKATAWVQQPRDEGSPQEHQH